MKGSNQDVMPGEFPGCSKRRGAQTDPSNPQELRRQSRAEGYHRRERLGDLQCVLFSSLFSSLLTDQYMCVRKLEVEKKNYQKGVGATVPRAHRGLVGTVHVSPNPEKVLLTYRASSGPQKGVASAMRTN